ncbi:hypothetical protein OHC98_26280 [Escherichia coli]|nr:hypothetical protein [Escherichia coli]
MILIVLILVSFIAY